MGSIYFIAITSQLQYQNAFVRTWRHLADGIAFVLLENKQPYFERVQLKMEWDVVGAVASVSLIKGLLRWM